MEIPFPGLSRDIPIAGAVRARLQAGARAVWALASIWLQEHLSSLSTLVPHPPNVKHTFFQRDPSGFLFSHEFL